MITHLRFSYNGQYPVSYDDLPDRIRLNSGLTVTNKDNFTLENLREAGYIDVPVDPVCHDNEKVIWNGSDWEVVALTDSEWNAKKQEYVDIMINEINIEIDECNNLIYSYDSTDSTDSTDDALSVKEGLDADYVTAMENHITTLNTLKDTTFPNADDPFSLTVPTRPEE